MYQLHNRRACRQFNGWQFDNSMWRLNGKMASSAPWQVAQAYSIENVTVLQTHALLSREVPAKLYNEVESLSAGTKPPNKFLVLAIRKSVRRRFCNETWWSHPIQWYCRAKEGMLQPGRETALPHYASAGAGAPIKQVNISTGTECVVCLPIPSMTGST